MTLIRQIEVGIEQGKVKAHLVRKALADKDINTRGLGYAMLTEAHLRAVLVEFKPKSGDPTACFQYLLDCIALDLEWDEDYAHSREDALFELSGVLDPFWAKSNVGVKPAEFWAQVSDVMRGLEADDVAVFLEGCDQDVDFDAAMKDWAADPELSKHLPA